MTAAALLTLKVVGLLALYGVLAVLGVALEYLESRVEA